MAKKAPTTSADTSADQPQPKHNTVIGGEQMPKGQKSPTTAKSVYVKFELPEDLELLARLEADAKSKRYDVATYIMLVLLEAYPAPASPAANQPAL
jgi:hypothetical protein